VKISYGYGIASIRSGVRITPIHAEFFVGHFFVVLLSPLIHSTILALLQMKFLSPSACLYLLVFKTVMLHLIHGYPVEITVWSSDSLQPKDRFISVLRIGFEPVTQCTTGPKLLVPQVTRPLQATLKATVDNEQHK
jgi:hypothetical protein